MTHAEYMREWRAAHPEYREYMRQWRERHRDHLKAYRRERYLAHQEEEIVSALMWQDANVVEVAIHRKIAAAHRTYDGRITPNDVRAVIDRDGWFCCWCKQPIRSLRDFTLEHLKPFNAPENLAISCRRCNCARLPSFGRTRRLTTEERKARIGLDLAKKRARDKKWKQENRDRENAGQRARYHANVEERRAYFREWQRKKRQRDQSARHVQPEPVSS